LAKHAEHQFYCLTKTVENTFRLIEVRLNCLENNNLGYLHTKLYLQPSSIQLHHTTQFQEEINQRMSEYPDLVKHNKYLERYRDNPPYVAEEETNTPNTALAPEPVKKGENTKNSKNANRTRGGPAQLRKNKAREIYMAKAAGKSLLENQADSEVGSEDDHVEDPLLPKLTMKEYLNKKNLKPKDNSHPTLPPIEKVVLRTTKSG